MDDDIFKKEEECYMVTAMWSNDLSNDYKIEVSKTLFNPKHDKYGKLFMKEVHSKQYDAKRDADEKPLAFKYKILVRSELDVPSAQKRIFELYATWFKNKVVEVNESIMGFIGSVDRIKTYFEGRERNKVGWI